ncbi:MAG: type II toxin-antitoxin system VapB family antitoxin [Mycobacteriales bacterium]
MKTVIDLDVELVKTTADVLGTKTKKATIHAALGASIEAARRKQERHQFLSDSLGSPDLGSPDIMSGAWR